jgi:hypothetical protein
MKGTASAAAAATTGPPLDLSRIAQGSGARNDHFPEFGRV